MNTPVIISEVGIGFMSLFAGLPKKIAPPEGVAKFWQPVAAMIAALAFLCVKLFAQMSASSTRAFLWGIVAFLFIVASIVLCFAYISYFYAWTFEYLGTLRVAGAEYTNQAQTHLQQHPNLTRAGLLRDSAGIIEHVWTPESLRRKRLTLASKYCLFIACLAFGLYLAVEVTNDTWSNFAFKDRVAGLRDVHFEFDRADLSQDATERLLDDVTILNVVLRSFPKAALIVEGYSDDQGPFAHNLTLGYKRAEVVREALAHAGIPADKIQVASHGSGAGLCNEPTEQCRKRNRRVHLTAVQ